MEQHSNPHSFCCPRPLPALLCRWCFWTLRYRSSRWGASRWCSSPTSALAAQRTSGAWYPEQLAGWLAAGWRRCGRRKQAAGCCGPAAAAIRHAYAMQSNAMQCCRLPVSPALLHDISPLRPRINATARLLREVPSQRHFCAFNLRPSLCGRQLFSTTACRSSPTPSDLRPSLCCRQLCTGESGVVPTDPPGREGAGKARHFKGAYFYRIIDQACKLVLCCVCCLALQGRLLPPNH